MPLSKAEFDAALARLRAERIEPISHFAAMLGATKESATRWIVRGRRVGARRVHLDGVKVAGKGWYSSRPAAERFLRECQEASASAPRGQGTRSAR